jgi:hypothetical protein
MKVRIILFLALLCSLTCWAQSPGKLDTLGKFPGDGAELRIATYTEGADKVGILGIWKQQPPRAATAFGSAEKWDSFVQLWQKASQTQSTSWQPIGTYKEVGTTDPTLLLVSAGPGVRLTMETADGTFSVVLSKSDYEAFGQAVQRVTDYLAH